MSKISVIIPTYNREKYITCAIDSVLGQSYKNYEIIVVDDGSVDNTKNALDQYSDKIRYIYQNNKGVSAARNTGIRVANGEWVAFLDSDDEWFPKKLEKQIEDIRIFPEAVLSCTNLIFKGSLEYSGMNYFNSCLSLKFINTQFIKDPFFKSYAFTSTVLVKREAIFSVGMFDEELKIYEDGDLFFRVSTLGGFVVNPSVLVTAYRREEDADLNLSANFAKEKEKYYISVIKVCQKYDRLNLTPEQRAEVLNKISNSWFDLGIVYHHEKKNNQARHCFTRSFMANRTWKNLVKFLLGFSGRRGISYIEKRRNTTKGFRRSEYHQHG